MRSEEFIHRVEESEKVIKYTLRLEIPKEEKSPKGSLISYSLIQAYKIARPLIWDRWVNHPFRTNTPGTPHFVEKGQKILSDAAVAELYCMIRKIIGEENIVTAYAASEYAFYDPEAFSMETFGLLNNFATGMDDLFRRKIYTFETDRPLIIKKKMIDVKDRGKKLGSRNQQLKTTINHVDAKLTATLPGYQSFFLEEEEKSNACLKKNLKGNLKISDLDLMVILKRSAKKLDALDDIQKTRQENKVLSIDQIQRLQLLHNELTALYKQAYKENDKTKCMTTDSLEHLTTADKLYIQMEIERAMNCTMFADLMKNVRNYSNEQTVSIFADPASVNLFSSCFELGNIFNRTDVLNLTFQGLQNPSTLLKNPKAYTMHTWESSVQQNLDGVEVSMVDKQKMSFFEQWKKVYAEEMDCWTNWIFPLFISCFCVVLNENIKYQIDPQKKSDQKVIQIMYKELSDYINENDFKLNTITLENEFLNDAKENSTIKMILSNYLVNALQEKKHLQIPVTLAEIDEIMPKTPSDKKTKRDYYLNYAKIQFLRRNNAQISSEDVN